MSESRSDTQALVWISGASSGIGQALAASVPWAPARVIGVSRRPAAAGVDHIEADLSDPAAWPRVGACISETLATFTGARVVFVQAAGTVDPMGFAGEVDAERYARNVLLNSAAPQVLGHLFIEAVSGLQAQRQLVMLTSGAARSIYPGWSSYGAAKAAVDQWVRDVGAEQGPDGVQVVAVAPGTVDTAMQEQLRATTERQFPQRQKFIDLHSEGKLSDVSEVARRIWRLLERPFDNGSVLDLREVSDGP